MTAIDLKAIRQRAAACLSVGVHTRDQLDRRQLIALVDQQQELIESMRRRLRYMGHFGSCPGVPGTGWTCNCGLDALLRDLDGGGQ